MRQSAALTLSVHATQPRTEAVDHGRAFRYPFKSSMSGRSDAIWRPQHSNTRLVSPTRHGFAGAHPEIEAFKASPSPKQQCRPCWFQSSASRWTSPQAPQANRRCRHSPPGHLCMLPLPGTLWHGTHWAPNISVPRWAFYVHVPFWLLQGLSSLALPR